MQDTAADPWPLILTLGPLLLLAAFVFVWWSNRKATPKDHGRGIEPTVGTTNAVRGSEDARPDIEAEAARAQSGDDRDEGRREDQR